MIPEIITTYSSIEMTTYYHPDALLWSRSIMTSPVLGSQLFGSITYSSHVRSSAFFLTYLFLPMQQLSTHDSSYLILMIIYSLIQQPLTSAYRSGINRHSTQKALGFHFFHMTLFHVNCIHKIDLQYFNYICKTHRWSVKEGPHSIANALELRLSCINSSTWCTSC